MEENEVKENIAIKKEKNNTILQSNLIEPIL